MAPKAHPWVDASAAPLLVQRYPKHFTDEEFAEAIEAVERTILAQSRPFVWIAELDNIVFVSMKQRRMFAESERRMAAHDRRYCAGTALVFTSPIVRSVIKSLYWLAPPVYPYVIVPDVASARRWAREQLASAARSSAA